MIDRVFKSILITLCLISFLLLIAFYGGNIIHQLVSDIRMDRYMPRGACMRWDPVLLWWHVITDAGIAISYVIISTAVVFAVRLEYSSVLQSSASDSLFLKFLDKIKYPGGIPWWSRLKHVSMWFAGFIIFCGIGHIWDVISIWHATPWFKAVNNTLTMYFSAMTVWIVLRHIPYLIKLVRQVLAVRSNSEQDRYFENDK